MYQYRHYLNIILLFFLIVSCSNATIRNEAIKKQGAAKYYYKQMDYLRAENSCKDAIDLWKKIKESNYGTDPIWHIGRNIKECEELLALLPKLESSSKSIVPIQINQNAILVEAILNQIERVTLLIDTGATNTIINPEIARHLDISPKAADPVYPMTIMGGSEIDVPFVMLDNIKVGDSVISNLMVGVYRSLPKSEFINGILGVDFLGRFELSINHQKSMLTLIPQKSLKAAEQEGLIGRWEGTSGGVIGALTFTADGRADFIESGVSLTESLSKNNGYVKYSIDTTKHPHHLDFISISRSGEEIDRLKMIFEYISESQIRVRANYNGDRPLHFVSDEDENTIILIKKTDD